MRRLATSRRPSTRPSTRWLPRTEGIEALLELGVDRLLTTGGPPTAWEGRDVLRELVQAAGDQLVVMPGGGVRQDHVHALLEHTGAREVHSSQVLIL